jgi:hypothetical protein
MLQQSYADMQLGCLNKQRLADDDIVAILNILLYHLSIGCKM